MRTRIKPPSAAMIVACLALFVALGGVGYAAATINGKDIKNGTVTTKKLKNGTVTNAKVKKSSLQANRLTARARNALKGNAGPQGPQGVPGLAGLEQIETAVAPSAGASKTAIATCPEGKQVTGGGVRTLAAEGLAFVDESIPQGNSWYGEVRTVNSVAQNFGIRVWVICATVNP